MSNLSDFKSMQKQINAVSGEDLKQPGMPVDIFNQEAEKQHLVAIRDKKELTGAGLSYDIVEELPVRIGALRYLQSELVSSRHEKDEAERLWKEKSVVAYQLHKQLLHDCSFAFRNDPSLLSRVNEIREGNGHADMIQDLSDLAVLCKKNFDLLKAINVPKSRIEQAATMSDELAPLLAKVNCEDGSDTKAKLMRDKAFYFAKQAVDEVREYGKYVFWDDKDKLADYASEYKRK